MKRPLTSFILLLSVILASCGEKEPAKAKDAPKEERYENEFPVRCTKTSLNDSYNWAQGETLTVLDAASGEKAGFADIMNGAGKTSALFMIHTNLVEGEDVILVSGEKGIYTPVRQISPEGSELPDAAVFHSSAFPLSESMTEQSLVFNGTILTIEYDSIIVDSLSISAQGCLLAGKDSPSVMAIPSSSSAREAVVVVDQADLSGKTLLIKIHPSFSVFSIEGKDFSRERYGKMHIAGSPVTPADRSKPEFSYTSIEYKTSASATSYTTALSSKSITVDGMNWMPKMNVDVTDRWGGLNGVKPDSFVSANTAGFWRTGKYKGRWVMVDPDGNIALLHGVNGVAPDSQKEASSGRTQALFKARFASNSEWASFANQVVAGYGFNFYSSNPKRIRLTRDYISEAEQRILHDGTQGRKLSEVTICYLLRTFYWDYYSLFKVSPDTSVMSVFALMFDPDYLSYIDELAADAAALYKDDKDFIGYYTDNELGFRYSNSSTPAIYLKQWLNLPTTGSVPRANAYAKAYAENFMREKYGVEPVQSNITSSMEYAFLLDISEYYYRTASEALRRHDPNHLILGSRLHGAPKAQEAVTEACAKYCDIVSVNVYGVWEPNDSYFLTQYKTWRKTDKPCFVTEFYTRDGEGSFEGEPYRNTGEGGGWIVRGQASRGKYYQNFTRKLLSYDHCIGWQWFQFTDDYSEEYGWNDKGLISPGYEPYRELLEPMRQLHRNIYQISNYYNNPSGVVTEAPSGVQSVWWEM